jgi:hypothetical protein
LNSIDARLKRAYADPIAQPALKPVADYQQVQTWSGQPCPYWALKPHLALLPASRLSLT